MDIIVDLLYFPIPATFVVGLIARFFLWKKGLKFLAIMAIPLFWIILFAIIASAISLIERKNNLHLKPHITIDRVFERNINTHDTRIKFYKFITTKDNSYLMAKVSIDPSLTTAIVRPDCIELSYGGTELSDPRPYSPEFLYKGVGPLTPANLEREVSLLWRIYDDIITTSDSTEIARNLDLKISTFEPCHTVDGGYL